MYRFVHTRVVVLGMVSAGLSACAIQPLSQTASFRADPLSADAAVLQVSVKASFADYRGATQVNLDTPLLDWREANALVEKIGGWRVYSRESAGDVPPLQNAR